MDKSQIFEKRLLVKIPASFQELEPETIEQMFPYEDRPQLILGNYDSSIFCTFSLLKEQRLASAQVKEAIQLISRVVVSLYPSGLLGEPDTIKLPTGVCGWFEYRTETRSGSIHNYMYIFSVDEVMMLGTMGCTLGDAEGEKQMMEIIRSLERGGGKP